MSIHKDMEQMERMKKDGDSLETIINRFYDIKKPLEELNKKVEEVQDYIIEQLQSKDEYKELLSELKENEEKGIRDGQDECSFLGITSLTTDSLIESHNIYKEQYEKAAFNYKTLEDDNRLDGDAAYKYRFNKEIYGKLKDEIVKRTVYNHIAAKVTERNTDMETINNPVTGKSR